MEGIVVRPARKTDCSRSMDLVHGLALYEHAPEQVTVSLAHFEESGFGNNPVWWAYVAEIDGRIVGFALWYIRYSTWKGQRMYLEDLYVEPEMRGKGIGALLFERLIKEAKLKEFSGLNWQALDWNEPALNFYRKYKANFDGEWINCSLDIEKIKKK